MAQYLCRWVGAYWFSATLISKWPPGNHIGYFGFRTFTSVWLWVSTPNFSGTILMYMGRSLSIFSYVNFKMAAWHAFSSVTQVCFGISVSNFMCISFVAVGRSPVIFSYVAFKMAALRFWTMFNSNPPISPCYPLTWGGNILVDHWSTISSFIYHYLIQKHVFMWYWMLPWFYRRILYKTCYERNKCNDIEHVLQWWKIEHF